jgi:hypothetical protein
MVPMTTTDQRIAAAIHVLTTAGRAFVAAVALTCASLAPMLAAVSPAAAQGFSWPWETEKPKPVPREPIPRETIPRGELSRQAPAPRQQPPPVANGWEPEKSSICLRLEQRLVQESQRGSQSQSVLPRIENDIRQHTLNLRTLQTKLDKSDCYEWFLFSKQLRNSRECRGLANELDEAKRQLATLEAEKQDVQATSGRTYQDEIIRELARNGCGSSYSQEARRREGGSSSSLWQDEDGSSGGLGNRFNAVPFATYRTVCVRLCDGYYFPISFSTLPNHFQRDAEACQQKCAAPAQLYYYQNPGGAVDQMQAFESNDKYTKLRTAFLYRKEYVSGCSCKQTEYVPQTPAPGGTLKQTDASGSDGKRTGPQIGDALDAWRPR